MEDYELTLYDRIQVIKLTNEKYDLEHNAYLSFSGGRDSTILHHLLDEALPNNTIPRVFIDTGIEYTMIREFVLKLAENDKRFVIIKPSKPIKKTLEEFGYPFKSKQHSHNVAQYQRTGMSKSVRVYLLGENTKKGRSSLYHCPEILKYQFTNEFSLKISDLCCKKMKKEPVKKWEKENNRSIAITGMRKEEGGNRLQLTCVITDSKGKIQKFHPFAVVSDEFEEWYRERERIELAKLYYPPFNFKRTGCKGCPFALELQEQLELLERYLPNERKQCEIIWQPVYAEYRRLNYRLKNIEKVKLF